jgi:hypothetical protein
MNEQPESTAETTVKKVKRIVTVSWVYTVEIELPADLAEDLTAEDMESASWGGESEQLNEIAVKAIERAAESISWKDGTITDIQEV